MFNQNFADVMIQTSDLWCRKQPPFQLSHNLCNFILLTLDGIIIVT